MFLKDNKIIGVITGDKINACLDKKMIFATDGLFIFGAKY